MSYQFPPSLMPIKKPAQVTFGIFSPQDFIKYSQIKIDSKEIYENKEFKIGGLSDPRLGCIERNMECATCGEFTNNCPGHFGYIQLETPVYHIGFIKYVKKILECVCHKCSRFRLLETDQKYKRLLHVRNRLDYAHEHAKAKIVCGHPDCEAQLLPLRREKGVCLYFDPKKIDKKAPRIPLPPEEARRILERMSDETCSLIGLDPVNARPEWMILTVIPVPPPSVRPSVHMDSTSKGEDDLTHVLTNIISYNNLVKKHENSRIIADYKEQLQLHVTSYIDNEVAGVPPSLQKGGRPIKSISARLKGKEGRIRSHLMGKRVDFSARTVITGDPHISIEEVGVPLSIARTLTFPERVSRFNIESLQEIVDRSPNYPGAKYVKQKGGERLWDLQKMKKELTKPRLQYGDIVERHMVTGDLVLFNRQPTLHKMSMMSHRARVMPYSTFRLNVNVCASYNADFDGDEMNLHMPQTLGSVAELEELTRVSKLLVSPQANKPVNALVQDALCGIRQFTKRDTFIDKEMIMNLILWVENGINKGVLDTDNHFWCNIPTPAIVKPKQLWTGKQIISLLLPNIDLTGYHSIHSDKQDEWNAIAEELGLEGEAKEKHKKYFFDMNPYDTKVVIDDGELLSGIICKKTVGASAGGIVHVIWSDYGPESARSFLDNTALLVNQWLLHMGFSVGLGDTILPAEATKRIRNHVDEQYRKVDALLELVKDDKLVAQGNLSLEETKEAQIINFLASARDGAGKMANNEFPEFNNLKQMVVSGSKGSVLNISQISAGVGQQIVDGRRIPYGFKDRTLPHFSKFDDGPESRGFVRNSFVSGLTPNEMFNHAMGGREGLIDTAVKTSETGYLQRRLTKSLEDLCIKYDGTVRNSRGDVVQYSYGEDGFDGTAIESQVFPTMMLSDTKFEKDYFVQQLEDSEWKLLLSDRNYLRENLRLAEDKWPLPLNIKRMIIRAGKGGYDGNYGGLKATSDEPLTYEEVYRKTSALRKRLRPSKLNTLSQEHPSMLFGILLSSMLASKQVLDNLKISRQAFEWILLEIEKRYHKGIVQAGESVGVIAAQSIGEPATQMTLNTFHQSGTGNKAVTSGIPRLKEIINAAKNLKTPSMTIYLDKDIRMDKVAVKKLCAKLEETTLQDVVSTSTIVYDHDYRNSVLEMDKEWLHVANSIPDEDAPEPHLLHPWMLRLVLSKDIMIKKMLSIHEVADRISEIFENDFFEMHSNDNSKELVIHLRIYKDDDELQGYEESRNSLQDMVEGKPVGYSKFFEMILDTLLQSVLVSGVPGIDKAFISQQTITQYDENGLVSDKKEYIIETDGINMKGCLGVEGVDASRIYCNDPQEMLSLFGIEISQGTLLKEIRSVIETGGSYINFRHLSLLCDVMTNRGSIMQITRHGIKRTEAGPLMKCTFEQPVDVLNDAAVNGDIDNIKGVAEHIILGQIAPIGTGMMDILLDEKALDRISEKELRINEIILSGGVAPPYGAESGDGAIIESRSVRDFFKSSSGAVKNEIKERKKPSRKAPVDDGGQGSSSGYNPLRPSYKK